MNKFGFLNNRAGGLLILAAAVFSACSPTIKVAAPDQPITINLNVKIDHEVRVRVDKDLDDVFAKKGELF